jgi:glycosyltransferase involved in cell wall biosynthesis
MSVSPISSTGSNPLISVVTPAYYEAENLPLLYEQLASVLDASGCQWEWIIVDDHSGDATFAVIAELGRKDARVRGVRFSRNFGSHMAIICGLEQARGECAVVIAADLQDPPQVIPELVTQWRGGAAIVYAVREARENHTGFNALFSKFFYFLMRNLLGLKKMPATGADFFLLDRKAVRELVNLRESNISILPLIGWLGFPSATIAYTKGARCHGQSGWSFSKKIKVVIDSVVSFSYLPIRVMSITGFVVAMLGFLYAGVVTYNALTGSPPQGWASTMVGVLVLGGIQMLMIGVLGEYLWRALDEVRQRPRYLIEASVGNSAGDSRKQSFSHERTNL